jgi:hypothetical protein
MTKISSSCRIFNFSDVYGKYNMEEVDGKLICFPFFTTIIHLKPGEGRTLT